MKDGGGAETDDSGHPMQPQLRPCGPAPMQEAFSSNGLQAGLKKSWRTTVTGFMKLEHLSTCSSFA